MSSRAERQATAVWLLTDALIGAGPNLDQIEKNLDRLRPYVLRKFDRPMIRIRDKIHDFILNVLQSGPDGYIGMEPTLAYMHMLSALTNDQWAQCPERPADRKRNWRRLNNAIAEYIEAGDPGGETGVELGCRWADIVKGILGGDCGLDS